MKIGMVGVSFRNKGIEQRLASGGGEMHSTAGGPTDRRLKERQPIRRAGNYRRSPARLQRRRRAANA
jgi:hypothetical protein